MQPILCKDSANRAKASNFRDYFACVKMKIIGKQRLSCKSVLQKTVWHCKNMPKMIGGTESFCNFGTKEEICTPMGSRTPIVGTGIQYSIH